jgi:methionyl aminopeptidase
MSVAIKTPDEIAKMRVAGRLASELLDFLTPHVRAGVTTAELDRIAHDYQVNVQRVIPATLNYAPPGHRPYPASICASVNHVVCHGIPGDKTLKAGDIVNIDVTVIKDGFHGDSSRMFYVGAPAIQAKRLCEVTFDAMWRGIAVSPATRVTSARRSAPCREPRLFRGARVLRSRHGRQFHEEPQVLHYGRPGTGLKLQPGMIFTIEPMINAGRPGIRCLADGWTIVTADHSLSAQWEHTVLVTDDGYEVLTVSDGAPPAPTVAQA